MFVSFAIVRRVFACVVVAGLLAGASSTAGRSSVRIVRAQSIGIVWLSTTGDDATCRRNDSLHPCASFGRSYQVAHSGDWVLVGSGTYPITDPGAGATTILPDMSKGGTVSFACLGDGDVKFAAPNFAFYPGVGGVAIHGGCFHFHVVHFGYGGSPPSAESITLDGVHMDSFECAGCQNVTIENSEVGPAVACYPPGATGNGGNGIPIQPGSWCDPNDPVQGYWATQPAGSANQQMEPYIHNGAAGTPTNVALIHNHFHGMQTKDSGNLHTGGLLIWNVNGLWLRGNLFDHNAIYDIESNNGDVENNVTIEGNVFGWPVYPLEASQPSPGGETLKDFRELTLGYPGAAYTNWTIRYNLLAHGLLMQGSWTNTHVVANILGNYSTCVAGVSYDHNVAVADGTPCGGIAVGKYPYLDYTNVNFQLNPQTRAWRYIETFRSGGKLPAKKTPSPKPKKKR